MLSCPIWSRRCYYGTLSLDHSAVKINMHRCSDEHLNLGSVQNIVKDVWTPRRSYRFCWLKLEKGYGNVPRYTRAVAGEYIRQHFFLPFAAYWLLDVQLSQTMIVST